jgi:cell shape-determining protein MreC
MANVGQSTRTSKKDLPDPLAEKRELRRMVQELEAENERLQRGLLEIMDYIEARREDGPMSGEVNAESLWSIAQSALDGGGGDDG